MSYDPTAELDTLVPAIADAFTATVLTTGVETAETIEGTHVPRRLPALQLVQTQVTGSHENEGGPVGLTEWRVTWRIDLYFQMKKYETAYAELGAVVPKILHLPIIERAAGGPILAGSCDWWVVVDEGDDPNPDDEREILYKKLMLQAVLTTRP